MQIAFASYERGDFELVPRVFYAPEATLETAGGSDQEVPLDLPSPVRGVEGVIHWLEVWHEPFSEVRYELGELYDGGDRALLVVDQVATGRASGVEVRQLSYSAVRWERGQVVWQLVTFELEAAMEAAGFATLPEPAE
jgi:ketosteroid isomerase-like protein